jgi:hypothetical protein
MPRVPSIKGAVFGAVAEQVLKLLERGDVSRATARRWLTEADFALLDAPVSIASWYDIGSFNRFSELLRDVEGDGRNEYLERMGRQSAKRLLDAGLYSQLEYLQRTRVAEESTSEGRHEAFGRDLRRLTTMSNNIYSFSTWTAMPDPENAFRYVIEVTDAGAMSDVICWRATGFMNEMAARHGDPNLWTWERVASDVVRFRMMIDL